MSRTVAALGGASLLAAACLSLAPASAAVGEGFETFGLMGAEQTFTVPAGVTAVTVDLLGATGGGAVSADPVVIQPSIGGGRTTASLSATPGQVLEVVVGGAGQSGSAVPFGAGAGGFNGGGDGGFDVDGAAPGGGGGGGATDIRAGSCTTPTPTCDATARVVGAGGGGGAGGGSSSVAAGGAGGGTTGGDGADTSDEAATGGGGATQTDPGTAGVGSSAGTAGDTTLGAGGPGGGGGGGGGGGLHGGGGGAANSSMNGAGGGGGSGFGPAGANLLTAGNTIAADGSAAIYWMTFSPAAPTVGESITFTSHLPAAAAGGTETFVGDAGTLCADVVVAGNGTAACTTTAGAPGVHAVTATFTSAANADPQFDGTSEAVSYTSAAQTTTTTASTSTTTATTAPTTTSTTAPAAAAPLAVTGPPADPGSMVRLATELSVLGATLLLVARVLPGRRRWAHLRRE